MSATFTKLKDGSWGLRVEGAPPVEGAKIQAFKKDGSSSWQTVGRVLWTGGNVSLCSIAPQGQAAPSQPSPPSKARRAPMRRNWRPCGYPGCNPDYCDDCDGKGYSS